MTANQIKGIWSVDRMYGPGAQSDEQVIFLENGFGWIEIMNWGSIYIETFNWSVDVNSKFNIVGQQCFSNYDETEVSDLSLLGIEIKVCDELTPSEEIIQVMNLSEPICINIMKLGLVSREVNEDYFHKRMRLVEK